MLAACSGLSLPGSNSPTPSIPPATPAPEGPSTLNICLGAEPSSLYLYGDTSSSARAVRQAIYDGPFDWLGYEPQPVIFETAPAPSQQVVTVQQGNLVVDAQGGVTTLSPGVVVRPAGCTDGDCFMTYTEGELQLDQVSITFTLKPGLLWSDGVPLTANDSVYSFEVAAAAETPSNKDIILKTASYTAGDERSVTWIGLPGFVDPAAATRFWHPLPRHAWDGLPAAELLTSEASTRAPLGWGPYAVSQWLPGERIELVRNSHYAGAASGQPHFSTLNFLFVSETDASALSGACDVILPSAGLQALDGAQGAVLQQDSWLQLVFGIRPQGYDDGFNFFADRPDFFGDAAMRRALAQCIDRDAIASMVNGVPAVGYLPAGSPHFNAGAALPVYDPAAANAALDQLGWAIGADGVRVNQSFTGALAGQRLELRLAASNSALDVAVAQAVMGNLTACGVAVSIEGLPPEELFATGPGSPVFGRNFDLALFAWPFGELPACYLFLGEATPGENLDVHKYGWGGWNVSGWQNAEFDAACQAALNTLAGDPAYGDAQRTAQAIFAEQLPALPLAVPQGVAAARAGFCGFSPQDGAYLLQDIEKFGYGSWCP